MGWFDTVANNFSNVIGTGGGGGGGIFDSISSALGTDGGGGGIIGAVEKTGQAIAEVPILKAAVIGAGTYFGGPAGAALAGSRMSRASGNSFNQSLWNGVGTGAAVAGAMYGADKLFGNAASTLGGASGMGGGTGLTLGAGGQTGLTLGGTGASTLGTGLGDYTLGSALGSGATGAGLGGTLATLGGMGGGSGLTVSGLGDYVLGSSIGGGATGGGLWDTISNVGSNIGNNVLNRVLGGGGGSTGGQQGGGGGGTDIAGLLGLGANLAGSYLNQQSAADAATKQADAQIRAAQIAADAAKFRPVGVTTNFGSSRFGYDASGNLNSAGYTLDPRLQAQQNQLMGASNGMLDQFTGSQAATAPMGAAANRMMSLGNQYLATDPQAQAAMYLQQQQGLLAPGRASTMADLQAQMQAQGRGGFAIGGGVNGQGAANPQLQALYNAQMQQDAQLAANATQGGMDYAKFGGAMVGSGGDMLRSQYGVQTAAYDPYKTALGGAQTIEGLGQNALTMGMDMGSTNSAANARAGLLTGRGMENAASTMAPTNAYSPWGALLSGGGQALGNYRWGT
jgi:hypothetical protein